MNLSFGVIIILSALTKATLQTCALLYFSQRLRPDLSIFSGQYVHCENEVISADFHTKIPPIDVDFFIKWLEINKTNSPFIPKGAFDNLTMHELRIIDAGVREISPGAFSGMESLTRLSLRANKMTEVKGYFFADLTELDVLDLSFNNIVTFSEDSFHSVRTLIHLNLKGNLITELSVQTFKDLPQLEVLDLSFNKLSHIAQNVFDSLPNLNDLFLNDNNFVEFNNFTFSKNLRFRNLWINNNHLKEINNLSFPAPLRSLNISYNFLESFISFSKHTSVKIIDLQCNEITSIKKYLFNNLQVEELYLDQNRFGPVVSDIFTNFPFIKTLSLSDNQIQEINPNLFSNSRKITKLNFSKNRLSNLNSMSLPSSLLELNVSLNHFNSKLNLTNLVALNLLDSSYNNFTELTSDFLKGLILLLEINLSHNKITTINSGCFRNLQQLRIINLSFNYISVLEVGVFLGLDELSSLDVSYNKLTIVNDGAFYDLKSLSVLNLDYNNVNYSSVENVLPHLTVLEQIGLAGNGLTCNSLSKIIKKYKRIKIMDVANHDVTNIHGVACKHEMTNSNNIIDLETESFSTLNSKLVTVLVLLILVLLFLVFKIIAKYISCSKQNKSKDTPRRRKIEKVQLVEMC